MASKVRCEIRYHGGIEYQDTESAENGDEYELLLLRITVQVHGSENPGQLQLHGRWATMLQPSGPGDLLLIEGAQEADEAEEHSRCFSVAGPLPVITIYREGFHFRIDNDRLQDLQQPEWLKLPQVRKVGGAYKYHRWLCTLRDGADSNLWAVVWENARPGPNFKDGWSRCGLVLVDPPDAQLGIFGDAREKTTEH
ncbi:unnamed protein product [Durusdinium trenchii]|uniref:Uncharacterized protein n=1 Tax=Durusdinium trenchii TaxID=1381693 RepID=A0ABP0JJQ6_9DINO